MTENVRPKTSEPVHIRVDNHESGAGAKPDVDPGWDGGGGAWPEGR